MIHERHMLLGSARIKYCACLVKEVSAAVPATIAKIGRNLRKWPYIGVGPWEQQKSATLFSEVQRKYLEQKFNINEATGRKQDPTTVARDMRITKNMDGKKLFQKGLRYIFKQA